MIYKILERNRQNFDITEIWFENHEFKEICYKRASVFEEIEWEREECAYLQGREGLRMNASVRKQDERENS